MLPTKRTLAVLLSLNAISQVSYGLSSDHGLRIETPFIELVTDNPTRKCDASLVYALRLKGGDFSGFNSSGEDAAKIINKAKDLYKSTALEKRVAYQRDPLVRHLTDEFNKAAKSDKALAAQNQTMRSYYEDLHTKARQKQSATAQTLQDCYSRSPDECRSELESYDEAGAQLAIIERTVEDLHEVVSETLTAAGIFTDLGYLCELSLKLLEMPWEELVHFPYKEELEKNNLRLPLRYSYRDIAKIRQEAIEQNQIPPAEQGNAASSVSID